jgi:putative peptidoglycan lipid II flippase
VLLLGLSGIVTGVLYALKRFTFPAFGAAVFNLGTVIAVPLLAGRLDEYSLAVGVLLGSTLQLLIQTPDLRGAKLSFRIDLSDPALRRIFALYLPIALGLLVSQIQIAIDRRLASGTGDNSLAWMANATTVVQLAHGLVAVAISQAVLPTLSRQSAAGDVGGFRRTLGQGLRLVLVLIVPATLGLLAMARPVVSLLFEHGQFTANDAFWTTWALRVYLLGLAFASIDWPLNFAFYARQDTLTPALVGIFSVIVYLAVALTLLGPLGMVGPLGMLSLVLADSAKHFSHAVTMLILTSRRIGGLRALGLSQTLLKTLLAGGAMFGLMAAIVYFLTPLLSSAGAIGWLAIVGLAFAVGATVYLILANALGVGEIRMVRDLVDRGRGAEEAGG